MNVLEQQLDDFRRTDDGNIIQGASHTCRILNHKYRKKIIIETYAHLKRINLPYDALVCCGASGLMVVPQIAELLNKNVIFVRKNEDRYSDFVVEGCSTRYYIIVDDLICSGNTARHMIKSIYAETPISQCLGIYSYMSEECAYKNNPNGCRKDIGIPYLNNWH